MDVCSTTAGHWLVIQAWRISGVEGGGGLSKLQLMDFQLVHTGLMFSL
jgi:hypothetical protein